MSDVGNRPSQGYGNIYTPHAGSMIIQVQREGGLANRTIVLTRRQVRLLRLSLYIGALLLTVGTITWLFFAAQAARVPFLTRRVANLSRDVGQLDTLKSHLMEMERRFYQVQQIMGATGVSVATPAPVPVPRVAVDTVTSTVPSLWPLEVDGYITRGNGGASEYNGPHPGVDVAVPIGTSIRASGGGTIVEVRDDEKYGKFVRMTHRDGYETLYAHASEILVKQGERVPAGKPIALSGNSGQSTAPHLHFEVRRGGTAVDPMQLIKKELQNGDLQ